MAVYKPGAARFPRAVGAVSPAVLFVLRVCAQRPPPPNNPSSIVCAAPVLPGSAAPGARLFPVFPLCALPQSDLSAPLAR